MNIWREYSLEVCKQPDHCKPFSTAEAEELKRELQAIGFEGGLSGWKMLSGHNILPELRELSEKPMFRWVLFTLTANEHMYGAIWAAYVFRGTVQKHELPQFDLEKALFDGWHIECFDPNQGYSQENEDLFEEGKVDEYQDGAILIKQHYDNYEDNDEEGDWVPVITRRVMSGNPSYPNGEEHRGFYWDGWFFEDVLWKWEYERDKCWWD